MNNNKNFLLPLEDTLTRGYCYDSKDIVYYKTSDKLIQFSSIYSIINSIFYENSDKLNTILTKISENSNLYNVTEDTILNDSDYTTGG